MIAGWFAMVAERVVAGAAALAGLGLLARSLDPDSFGAWALATMAWSIAESVRGGLVNGAYLRYHPKLPPEARGGWLVAAALLGVAGSVAGGLLGVAVAAAAREPTVRGVLAYTPEALGAAWLIGLGSLALQTQRRFGGLLLVRLVAAGGWIGALVALPPRSAAEAAGLWAGTQLAAGLVAAILAAPRAGLAFAELGPAVRALADHGGRALAGTLASSLLRSADLAQIGAALGPAASGTYAQALRPVDVIEVPLQAAASVLAPRLAQDALHGAARAAERAAAAAIGVSAIGVALGLPLVAFAPAILEALVGVADPAAVGALRALVLTNALRPFDRMIGLTLEATGHPGWNAAKVWFALGLNVAVNAVVLAAAADPLPAVAVGSFVATAGSVAVGEWFAVRTLGVGVVSSVPRLVRPFPALVASARNTPRSP